MATEEQRQRVLELAAAGHHSQRQIADEIGINRTAVFGILKAAKADGLSLDGTLDGTGEASARERANCIRYKLSSAAGDIMLAVKAYAKAVQADDWRVLGYDSVEAWHEAEFGMLRFKPAERKMVAALLAAGGMTVRDIAAAIGVSHPTVVTDLAESGGQDLTTSQSARQAAALAREQAKREEQARREQAEREAQATLERERASEEDGPPYAVNAAVESLLRACETVEAELGHIARGVRLVDQTPLVEEALERVGAAWAAVQAAREAVSDGI